MSVTGETSAKSQGEFGLQVSELTRINTDRRNRALGLTMVLVYVLGIASANHKPIPLRKPLPSALT